MQPLFMRNSFHEKILDDSGLLCSILESKTVKSLLNSELCGL